MGLIPMIERSQQVHQEMHKRGLRVLPGGDYGFAWNPNGTNARDLEHFINLFGYTSNQVLSAATQLGGQIMDSRSPVLTVEPCPRTRGPSPHGSSPADCRTRSGTMDRLDQ